MKKHNQSNILHAARQAVVQPTDAVLMPPFEPPAKERLLQANIPPGSDKPAQRYWWAVFDTAVDTPIAIIAAVDSIANSFQRQPKSVLIDLTNTQRYIADTKAAVAIPDLKLASDKADADCDVKASTMPPDKFNAIVSNARQQALNARTRLDNALEASRRARQFEHDLAHLINVPRLLQLMKR